MDIPIARYAPGGDIYQTLSTQYGTAAAQKVYQAALTNDRGAVSEAIGEVRNGAPLDDSTASNFLDLVTTDPLAAPLQDVNNLVGNSVLAFLKNPWVLFALAVGAFLWLGGADLIRGWIKRHA